MCNSAFPSSLAVLRTYRVLQVFVSILQLLSPTVTEGQGYLQQGYLPNHSPQDAHSGKLDIIIATMCPFLSESHSTKPKRRRDFSSHLFFQLGTVPTKLEHCCPPPVKTLG